MNSRKTNLLLKDTAVFAIGSLGSKIILFLLVPLYTNALSTEQYGTADLISTITTLIAPVAALSIDRAVLRYGMKTDMARNNVIRSAMFVLAVSIAPTLLAVFLLRLYRPASEWVWFVALGVLFANTAEIGRAYLKVKGKNRLFAEIGIVQTAILAASNIVFLAIMRKGVGGYLTSSLLSAGAAAIACIIGSGVLKDVQDSSYDRELTASMARYSAPLVLSGISWWVLHSSDKVMIEAFIGASALGMYTAATKIPSLLNVITGLFNQAWTLSSIREVESNSDGGFYSKVFNLFSVVMFGAGMVLAPMMQPFMSIYVGSEFRAAWQYIPLLLYAAVFYSLYSVTGSMYAAIEKTNNDMCTSVLCAVLNIMLNYLGIKTCGVWGAIISTAFCYTVFTFVRIADLNRYISFDVDVKLLAINALLGILEFAIVTTGVGGMLAVALIIAMFGFLNRLSIVTVLASIRDLIVSKVQRD